MIVSRSFYLFLLDSFRYHPLIDWPINSSQWILSHLKSFHMLNSKLLIVIYCLLWLWIESPFVRSMTPSLLTSSKNLSCRMIYLVARNHSCWEQQRIFTGSDRSIYEYNVITDSRKAIILSLVDVSSFSHTADFLVTRLESVLAKPSIDINITTKIRALVTDNPHTMKKIRETFISKPGNQHIIGLRCFAHAINLIAGMEMLLCCW